MTGSVPFSSRSRQRAQERRAGRKRRFLRWGGVLLLLALVFFAGLAAGQAIEDVPGSEQQTLVRTLVPTTLTPPKTVTVTVSKP